MCKCCPHGQCRCSAFVASFCCRSRFTVCSLQSDIRPLGQDVMFPCRWTAKVLFCASLRTSAKSELLPTTHTHTMSLLSLLIYIRRETNVCYQIRARYTEARLQIWMGKQIDYRRAGGIESNKNDYYCKLFMFHKQLGNDLHRSAICYNNKESIKRSKYNKQNHLYIISKRSKSHVARFKFLKR